MYTRDSPEFSLFANLVSTSPTHDLGPCLTCSAKRKLGFAAVCKRYNIKLATMVDFLELSHLEKASDCGLSHLVLLAFVHRREAQVSTYARSFVRDKATYRAVSSRIEIRVPSPHALCQLLPSQQSSDFREQAQTSPYIYIPLIYHGRKADLEHTSSPVSPESSRGNRPQNRLQTY